MTNKKSKTNEPPVATAADDEPLAKKAKLHDPSVAAAVVAATSDGKAEGSPTSLGAASGAHATSPVDGGGAGADFTTPIKTHRAVAASADLKANGTQDGIGASSGVPETATAGRLDTITKDSPAPPPPEQTALNAQPVVAPPSQCHSVALFRTGMLQLTINNIIIITYTE